jgi:hypothetical protein
VTPDELLHAYPRVCGYVGDCSGHPVRAEGRRTNDELLLFDPFDGHDTRLIDAVTRSYPTTQ